MSKPAKLSSSRPRFSHTIVRAIFGMNVHTPIPTFDRLLRLDNYIREPAFELPIFRVASFVSRWHRRQLVDRCHEPRGNADLGKLGLVKVLRNHVVHADSAGTFATRVSAIGTGWFFDIDRFAGATFRSACFWRVDLNY